MTVATVIHAVLAAAGWLVAAGVAVLILVILLKGRRDG